MDDSYNEFDKHIKAKLENFDVSGAPEGWDALEGKMAADADLSVDPFDEMIKSKLEGSNIQYEPGLWSLMESRIEQDEDLADAEIDDMELDGMLYEALNNYKVAYNPNHWDLMLQRIKEEFSIQHHLYKYKVAEVSLMILAILTLLQFYPGQVNHGNQTGNGTEMAGIVAVDNSNANSEIASAKNSTSASEETNTKNINATSNNLIASAKTKNSKPSGATLLKNKTASKAKTAETKSASNGNIPSTLPILIKETHGIATVSEEEMTAIDQKADAVQQIAKGVQQAQQTENAQQALNADQAILLDQSILDRLLLESMQIEYLSYDYNNTLPTWKAYTPKRGWAFKLGMMASVDFNLVMTPYDEYFSSASYDQLATGYTGGLSFSIHKNRWAIATGAMYSSKSYETKENKELKGNLIDGYISESLEAAQLNILSVPLNLTYTFDNSGKWQWYALAGVSAKLATINNFDKKKEKVGGGSRNQDPRIQALTLPHEEEKDEYLGAFEGGDFNSNLFFTANLGFGMERYVTPRWSVFFQPTYQHSFYKEGLSPNNDRIHSMSLFLGTRATLK